MGFVRNPVAVFLVIGGVIMAGIVVASYALVRDAAETQAVAQAQATTTLLAESVAEPALPRGLVAGEAGAVDRLDRDVLDRLLVAQVRRIKIWDRDGVVLYSDRTELIGTRSPLDRDKLEVLDRGGVDAEVSDLGERENRLERTIGRVVEVYTRIESPEGEPLLFEVYYADADVARTEAQVFRPFRRITLGALVTIVAVAAGLLLALSSRLTRAARERESLLRRAADASAAERRRIARDLHDGVVQDLAGTAFGLHALSAEPDTPPALRSALAEATNTLRSSQRSLRSLMVEIHPPDLGAEGLAGALHDLTAPAVSAGVHTSVEVHGVEHASDGAVALIWRVAQEAVRNTVRHAHARRLELTVTGDQESISMEVHDDGVGFAPDSAADSERYGLRGLRSLVDDAGGQLVVRSSPDAGTTVRVEVPAR